MSILPPGSLLTFTDTPSSTTAVVAVNTVKYRTTKQTFKRLEFSHKRLREAPNIDGSMPIIQFLVGNRPVFFFSNCNDNEVGRDLTPDDSVYDDIYKRFDIRRYQIIGATSPSSETDTLFAVAKAHAVLNARFEAFLAEAAADVSVNFLTAMQSDDLMYVVSTGLAMSGACLGSLSPESNMLIMDFESDVTYEIPDDAAASSSTIMRTFQMTIESRTLVPERSTTY